MRENLQTLMHGATEQLQVQWDPPEAIRRRAQRRRLRWRAAAAFVAVSMLGLGGGVVLAPAGPPRFPEPDPTPSGCVVDLTLPASESEVKLRVYHAAVGVATVAADDFRRRGFDVVEAAATTEATGDFSAVIRFGPAEVGEARLVQAYLLPDLVAMEFDPPRSGPVDVILGPRFRQLVTAQEMRARMAELGPLMTPGPC